MAALRIASKSNQAITVPVLLVANYANETDPNSSINIKIEEAENLKSGDKAAVELVIASNDPAYGTEQVISTIAEAYHLLQGKNEAFVGYLAL